MFMILPEETQLIYNQMSHAFKVINSRNALLIHHKAFLAVLCLLLPALIRTGRPGGNFIISDTNFHFLSPLL